jgi:spore maturation protein CgeB
VENDEERIQLVEKQKSEVLAAHTYHHRMHTMLSSLGFDDEAASMLD